MTRYFNRRFFPEIRRLGCRILKTTISTVSNTARSSGILGGATLLYPMPEERRIEDKIRELCSQLTKANGDFDRVLAELRLAITEHTRRINNKTSATVLSWPEYPRERRRA